MMISKITRHTSSTDSIFYIIYFFSFGATAPSGPGPRHSRGFQITHSDAPQSVGLLWTSDQLVAETSTRQHTTLTTNKTAMPRWDSNLQSQQASGRRPSQTARTLGKAYVILHTTKRHCTEPIQHTSYTVITYMIMHFAYEYTLPLVKSVSLGMNSNNHGDKISLDVFLTVHHELTIY